MSDKVAILIAEHDIKHILDNTGTIWPHVAGKIVFLTGGTGFFGKWLLESFAHANERLDLGAKMIVLSRRPEVFLEDYPVYRRADIVFVQGDIRDFTFPEEPIDYIIHAATEASVSLNLEQPLLMFDTIVDGTRRVLELAREKKVTGILHTSSGAVYGVQPWDMTHTPETFMGCPDVYDKGASYGEGKRVAEMLCNIYSNAYGVPSKIARCFAFAGPYLPLDTHFAIGNFMRDVLNGNDTIVIKGDGTPYRSYLYAADLVVWLWHILVHGEVCEPYNVGSDEDMTIATLARRVAAHATAPMHVEILTPESGKPVTRYVPDVTKAKTELKLKVLIDLDESIARTIAFSREHNV